jgi:uncharacterized protein
MKILLGGATGFVGSFLAPFLKERGHIVFQLVRQKNLLTEDRIFWNPETGAIDPKHLEGFDAVINLAGENIFSGRWTEERKKKIKNSRIDSTLLLARTLAELKKPPRVFVNASAMGYYGDRGDAPLTETSPQGKGFLAGLCREWEEATSPALARGIRVVLPRLGLVLSPKGGALKMMLVPFKLGLGGKLGSGKQYVSWIDIRDLVRIFYFALTQESLRGPINAATPNPVQNEKMVEILAAVLNRPAFLTMSEGLLKLILGQLAEEVLLSSTRMIPKALQDAGFEFHYPHLKEALQMMLLESK